MVSIYLKMVSLLQNKDGLSVFITRDKQTFDAGKTAYYLDFVWNNLIFLLHRHHQILIKTLSFYEAIDVVSLKIKLNLKRIFFIK